jgi:hypothetical protein
MKRKLAIVSLLSLLVGNLWGRFELEWRQMMAPPGQAEVRALCDLYDGGLLTELQDSSNRDLSDARYTAYFPRILYIRWETARRLSMGAEADRIRSRFLLQFPRDPFGADMLWEEAMRLLAAGNYSAADGVLSAIMNRYPASPLRDRAEEILNATR